MPRFTISLDDALAEQFDGWMAQHGYDNRSEAVRDLLRSHLQQTRVQAAQAPHCVGCLSYVYDHHERDLAERMARIQHDHHDIVVSTSHISLDHHHRLEMLALRGHTPLVLALADAICAERGVHHGKLNLVTVELHQPHHHGADAGSAPHVHLKPAH